ncbi:hypothetical protein F7725_011092 [Dissostichus mawsoni]|uniref:Homeobox domain-containing protein n=1 Tax=Dissostichus mawsoni TaxID=36200 RepID=A0A7J5Z9P2_DISMA|nr:hypothetical protein F7725_011092 [Dissostichus mawsoni]
MEIEVGDHHMDDEEMEETTEEKEEEASEDIEESADCEANTDKSVREGSESAEPADEVAIGAKRPKVRSISSCFLCDDCPDNLEALHLLQHYKAANGEAIDSAALDPSFAALLSGAGVVLEEPPVDDLLSLLKTYFASNANPSEKELTKISESVSFPLDVVRKWFAKMNSRKNVGKDRKKRRLENDLYPCDLCYKVFKEVSNRRSLSLTLCSPVFRKTTI